MYLTHYSQLPSLLLTEDKDGGPEVENDAIPTSHFRGKSTCRTGLSDCINVHSEPDSDS